MAKYNKGETSPEVKRISDNITKSINDKTRLIRNATVLNTVPDYIPLNKNKTKINMGDIHAWESEALGLIKYSYNTADTDKNKEHLNNLKVAVLEFNRMISSLKSNNDDKINNVNSRYLTRDELLAKVHSLKREIEVLDREVVEIFRAYNQLRSFITTHNFDNDKYHEILKLQTQTLNNKLRTIK